MGSPAPWGPPLPHKQGLTAPPSPLLPRRSSPLQSLPLPFSPQAIPTAASVTTSCSLGVLPPPSEWGPELQNHLGTLEMPEYLQYMNSFYQVSGSVSRVVHTSVFVHTYVITQGISAFCPYPARTSSCCACRPRAKTVHAFVLFCNAHVRPSLRMPSRCACWPPARAMSPRQRLRRDSSLRWVDGRHQEISCVAHAAGIHFHTMFHTSRMAEAALVIGDRSQLPSPSFPCSSLINAWPSNSSCSGATPE